MKRRRGLRRAKEGRPMLTIRGRWRALLRKRAAVRRLIEARRREAPESVWMREAYNRDYFKHLASDNQPFVSALTPAGAVAGGRGRRRARSWRGAGAARLARKAATTLALWLVAASALHAAPPEPQWKRVTRLSSHLDPTFALRLALTPELGAGESLYDVVCTSGVATCGGGGGASLTGNNTWGGTQKFPDDVFQVVGSADATKILRFEVDGFTTGTTRTATFPNVDGTVAYANQNTAVSGAWSFTQGPTVAAGAENALIIGAQATFGAFFHDVTQTPDTIFLGLGTNSGALNIGRNADEDVDLNNGSCGTVSCTNGVQVNLHANASATEYKSLAFWGSAGRATKTLVDATLTSVFQVSVADNVGTGGTVAYSVFASDGTAHQLRSGQIYFSAVNEGGTETCATPTDAGTSQISATTGTLTCTFDCDETPTNGVNIQFNCNTSLTPTTMEIYYQVTLVGPGQVTPQ